MGEGPIDHVGDSFEAAVGMPRRPFGLARGVIDFSHLVHVHEGVELREAPPSEGATNREPFALEPAWRRRHCQHLSLGCRRAVRGREPL